MQTTLIYNPQAGIASNPGPNAILQGLRQAGYQPEYIVTSSVVELEKVLAKAEDLVVVAGGDGTLRAVATRLLDRDVRIAPVPIGTANNVARMLALTGRPLDIIAGLADPVERALDIGRMTTPNGAGYFLEAMGIGIYADILEKYDPKVGKSIPRGIQSMLETLTEYLPKFFHVDLDGEDLSGSYFLFEVMNTPTLGFRFMLAPDAQADDGLFDLVLIHANERDSYLKFMTAILTGSLDRFPSVSVIRGRKLKIAWRGFPLHLDEEVVDGSKWPREETPSQSEEPDSLDVSGPFLRVEIVHQAVRFLVPRTTMNETEKNMTQDSPGGK